MFYISDHRETAYNIGTTRDTNNLFTGKVASELEDGNSAFIKYFAQTAGRFNHYQNCIRRNYYQPNKSDMHGLMTPSEPERLAADRIHQRYFAVSDTT